MWEGDLWALFLWRSYWQLTAIGGGRITLLWKWSAVCVPCSSDGHAHTWVALVNYQKNHPKASSWEKDGLGGI